MGNWSLGSVHDAVLSLIPDVPSSISGARLLEIADQKRNYVEQYTGKDIGSTSIELKYQGPILYFTAETVSRLMNLQGADVSSVSLGDFSESKGGDTNLNSLADGFRAIAKEELSQLGTKILKYKARG
jgi:hypothetical protein